MTVRHGLLCLLAMLVLPPDLHGAEFTVERRPDAIIVTGEVSSDGHADTLHKVAGELFDDAPLQFALVRGSLLPPGWSLLTEQALRALAETPTGQAAVTAKAVVLRGRYDDAGAWQRATSRLSAALLPGMELRDLATASDSGRGLDAHCAQQFAAATQRRRVDFRLNSSELRSSAWPLLDALVEIAADCPTARIQITGHTDASGSEGVNIALSRARAQAVADYIAGRGISSERLSVHGAGASQPLGDGATRAARARNRRIEFAFSFAE